MSSKSINSQELALYLGCLILNEVQLELLRDEAFIFSPLACTVYASLCHRLDVFLLSDIKVSRKSMPQITTLLSNSVIKRERGKRWFS